MYSSWDSFPLSLAALPLLAVHQRSPDPGALRAGRRGGGIPVTCFPGRKPGPAAGPHGPASGMHLLLNARRSLLLFLTALLVPPVAVYGDSVPPVESVWVFLRDKPAGDRRLEWPRPEALLSSARLDLDVDGEYIDAIRATGAAIRTCSRWFNAVSVDATPEQMERLVALPFMRETAPVRRAGRDLLPGQGAPRASAKAAANGYGPGFEQLSSIGVVALHNQGFTGEGIRIALLDAGFPNRDHRAFAHLDVVAERDFVNGAAGETGPFPPGRNHGTQVLSVLAARDPGHLVGAAPDARYLLATTEEIERELPLEEDLWVAGVEWADSLGADVVNSSVGYNQFEDGTGYSYEELDGRTALATIAAEIAVSRGIVVVAAAGNEGNKPWRYVTVPADGPNVIAVGAVGLVQKEIAPFSSRGPTADGRIKPDVVAPGISIVVVDTSQPEPEESFSGYRRARGTSFATPLVSGAAALLRQIHPAWTPADVAAALKGTALDLGVSGPDTTYGWGMVNALAASGVEIELPRRSLALAPFPNPLRFGRAPEATLFFPLELASADEVEISIFTAAGQLVGVASQRLEAGRFTRKEQALRWRAPAHLASGIYLYRLQGGGVLQRGKIALIR